MIVFISICAVMIVAAVALLVRPLLGKQPEAEATRPSSRASMIVLALLVPVVAIVLYVAQSNWNWDQAENIAAQQLDVKERVVQLERRLIDKPDDLQGWLMLGRAYLTLEQPGRAVDAYQKAHALAKGENTEAALGLGEALFLTDQSTLNGRAGQLFESVLSREPNNPTALWYGAIAALAVGKLEMGRQRIATLLKHDVPPDIRNILERQLQDLDQQLGKPSSLPQVAQDSGRILDVQVSIDAALASKVDKNTPLFVLARDPVNGGPPLAAVRRVAGDLPLKITLSDKDAMMQGRGIGSVQKVQVVARISKSGTPQAQLGDLFGEALAEFTDTKPVALKITIDRKVEK